MSLPFELYKYHKRKALYKWKYRGLNETDEFIEEIYNRYIVASHCELCNKEFKTTPDRHMDHCHETGKFRNIVCTSCNLRKHDVKARSDNTSGYKGISKSINKEYKQGFRWVFQVVINGKRKLIKSSVDLEFLKSFASDYLKENNYYT